jgi:hypothetical protein
MNPVLIEQAIQTALNASAFPTTQIYHGTSYDELTPESLNLVVSVNSLNHEAQNLYTASVGVRVTAPALLGADSYAQFSACLASLKDAMGNDYFLAHWPTGISAPSFVGLWHENTATSVSKNEWQSDLTYTFGLLE